MQGTNSTHNESTTLKDWGLLFILCLIWGSSFILIKKGLLAFKPIEVGALRNAISAIAFIPIYLWIIKERVPWNKMKWVIVMGLLGNGITAVIYPIAQTQVDSSVAGILNSMTPIFTWFAGMLFFATRFKANQMSGVLIGFAGAAMLIFLNHRFQFSLDKYSLLIMVATLSYGFSANIVKVHLQDVHPIAMTAVAIFVIGIPAIGYLITTDTIQSIGESTQAKWSFLAIVILSVGGSVSS